MARARVSRHTEQMAVTGAKAATILVVHLAAQVPPAAPPTPASTTCPQAAHRPGTEPRADCATAGAHRPGTDDEGPWGTEVAGNLPAPTPGAQVEEPAGGAGPSPPVTLDERAHHGAAAD